LLQKREWLLGKCDSLHTLDSKYTEIERRPLPDFATFVEQYYSNNRPVIFTAAVDHWKALSGLFDDVGNIGDDYMDMSRLLDHGYLWFGPRERSHPSIMI
jgi:hypothetical protein